MKTIKVEVKTINPVIIPDKGFDSTMTNTKSFIPGNSILGLFAKQYIKSKNLGKSAHRDDFFKKIFLDGGIVFSNLFIKDEKREYVPTPLSVRYAKNNKSKIYDLLLQDDDFDIQTKNINSFSLLNDETLYIKSVKKGIAFHHARDRERGTSKEGIIFNYEYIKEEQMFVGDILGEDTLIEEFFENVKKEFYGRIGKSKNSQYGKVKVKLSEPVNYDSIDENELDNEEVIMTLLSDAIIYNEFGFSTTDVRVVERYLGTQIKKAFIKQDRNEQFVGIWHLKKQSENVISAGSCFLLESLPEKFREFAEKGIGERVNEGFGRVIFNYQQEDKFSLSHSNAKTSSKRPQNNHPEEVRDLVIAIVKEKILEKVKKRALEEASDFKRIPSKSFLGKLQSMSKDIGSFQSNFEQLSKKDIAKNQLNRCHNNNETLKDYINNKLEGDFSDVESDFISLLQDVGLKESIIQTDRIFAEELKSKFFLTFFNFLRKKEVKDE